MATLEYHIGARGYPGYTVTTTTPNGSVVRQVVPAMALTASDGTAMPAGSATDPSYTQQVPASAGASALTPVTVTSATSLIVKGAPGNFYGASITAGATAGLLIAYNSATVPGAGANLTQTQILGVVAVAANGSAAIGDFSIPDRFSAGVTLLFSTTLATFTAPANPAQFLRGRAI